MSKTATEWRALSASLDTPDELFVDGQFEPAASGQRFDTVDPATGETIAAVARGGPADVDRAVDAARKSFVSGSWSQLTPAERRAVLLTIADAIDAKRDELAALESVDGGKLVRDTVAFDIPGTAAILRWYAEAIDKVYGEVAPVGPGVLAVTTREPLGVIGAVVPWNFPIEMAMWKLAPALAVGNSVVLKPAEQTPLSALYFAELCRTSGLPDGVLNVITGNGPEAGRAIGLHDDIDAVAFTGSTAIGKQFLRYAADSNFKQVWPECGGKSANVVFDDIADLDDVAEQAVVGAFACSGQVCSANSRLLVHRSRASDLIEAVVERTRQLKVGDPLDANSDLGPLISRSHRQNVQGFIEKGRSEADLVTGGGVPTSVPSGGFYLEPTVFTNVAPGSIIFDEEIFGPVLSVTVFDDEAEAIALANATQYGLAASVFTDDLRRAHRVSQALQAGTVSINCVDAIDVTVPFGGFKQSGYGRDLSLHALEKYTGLKTRWFAP